MELFYDLKCYVTGDSIDFNETSLIIMNHRTRLDWMFFLWSALFKLDAALLTKIKIALKSAIKTYPAASKHILSLMRRNSNENEMKKMTRKKFNA